MSEFVDYLHEVFAEFGPVTPRRMFGGHGIFFDGVMIALVADDVLYLKVDGETEPRFEALGLPAFKYRKGSREVSLSYRQAPAEALDEPGEMVEWARIAYAAALRQKA